MARVKKADIKQALEDQLRDKQLDGPVYRNQVDQYLAFYDRLRVLNRLSVYKGEDGSQQVDLEALKEARQVAKSMRDILAFLGLRPVGDGGGGSVDL